MQTGTEGELPAYPSPDELWDLTFAEANAWRDRFAAVPFEDKGGSHPSRYYQDIAVERVMEAIAAEQAAHPAHAGHRHRQDLHRLPDRLEALPQPLEPEPRARRAARASSSSPTATSSPTRPTTPSPPSPRTPWCASRPADIRKKGKVPKNGSLFFTIFQTFMSGPPQGRQALALLRRVPARLLRLHRHRRVPPRRRQRREQLARHPRLLRARRAARPDRHAQAQGQRRHLRLLRRAGLHLLAQGRHQRRLPHALQGEADLDHARRVRLHPRRHS